MHDVIALITCGLGIYLCYWILVKSKRRFRLYNKAKDIKLDIGTQGKLSILNFGFDGFHFEKCILTDVTIPNMKPDYGEMVHIEATWTSVGEIHAKP